MIPFNTCTKKYFLYVIHFTGDSSYTYGSFNFSWLFYSWDAGVFIEIKHIH